MHSEKPRIVQYYDWIVNVGIPPDFKVTLRVSRVFGIFLTKQPRSCWLLLGLCGRISQETLGGRMQSPLYDLEHLLYAYNTSECHMGILNMH